MKTKPEGNVIEVDHIRKVYTTKNIEYMAIKDVSISLKKGEFVSVLGPSGSGKTTLMNLIGTLDRPTHGRILLDGIDVSSLNDNQLANIRNIKIGFIFQSYNLVPYLNVLQNVVLSLMVNGRDTPEKIEDAKRLLTEIGMGTQLDKKPNELSGGQQQRVAIARALINNPQIILADEPTGNLDSKTAESVLNLIIKECEEKHTTILVVTHDPDVAALSERSIYMKDGLIEKQVKNRH
jgi:putative ABC transport system ATP-binding protein